MPRDGKNPGHDVSEGKKGMGRGIDHKQTRHDFDREIADPEGWGEPLSYVELLTDPSVQSRVARLIVQSALKRSYRGR